MPTKEFPDPPGSSPAQPGNSKVADSDSGTSMKQDWTPIGHQGDGVVYITPASNIIITDIGGHTTKILPMDD